MSKLLILRCAQEGAQANGVQRLRSTLGELEEKRLPPLLLRDCISYENTSPAMRDSVRVGSVFWIG